MTKYKYERAVSHLQATVLLFNLARLPNVKKLELEFRHQYEEQPGLLFEKLCLAYHGFVVTHLKTLKILNWSIQTNRFPSRLPIPRIPQILKETLNSDSNFEEVHLELWGVGQIEMISMKIRIQEPNRCRSSFILNRNLILQSHRNCLVLSLKKLK